MEVYRKTVEKTLSKPSVAVQLENEKLGECSNFVVSMIDNGQRSTANRHHPEGAS